MAIDGVGGKQHTDIEKRDMVSLGIQENSKEASIFNKIDEADGVRDGELSVLQLFLYKCRTDVAEVRGQQEERLKKVDEDIEQEKQYQNARLDIKQKFPEAKFDSENNTVTIESLNIVNFEISNLQQIKELEHRIKVEKTNKQAEQRDNETIKGPNFGLS